MATDRSLPKGEFIFREGESADYAYVLKAGSVELLKMGLEGEVVLVNLDTPNALFGEMALIDGEPRSASARAVSDITITEIQQNDFLAYVQENPTAAMNIMKKMSTELRKANKAASITRGESNGEYSDIGMMETGDIQKLQEIDDTDAIYDTSSSRSVVYTTGVLLVFLLTGTLFAFQAVIDTTVSARGKFTNEVPNVEVQAASSAVVDKVLIKRGQLVKKNQLLVLLDNTVAEADLKSTEEKLQAVEGRLRRFRLERSLIKSQLAPPNDHDLSALNLDILNKRLGQYRSKISSFASKIKKIEKEIATAKTKVSSARETIKITKEQFDLKKKIEAARKKLYDSEHGSMLAYLQARDVTLASRRSYFDSVNNVAARVAAMTANISDKGTLLADKNEFVAKWSSQQGENLAKAQETFIQLKQEAIKLTKKLKNVEVRAPVSGIILDIPTVSRGSIVKEGDRLITLVLINQPMSLEVDVDPKDISDVKLNISVSVKLDALPFQQYGDIDGRLVYISDDTYNESLFGDKGAFYRGRVDIPAKELAKLPSEFRLTPGMLASADMKVGEKRVIAYLTHPIIKGFSSAFSEPD